MSTTPTEILEQGDAIVGETLSIDPPIVLVVEPAEGVPEEDVPLEENVPMSKFENEESEIEDGDLIFQDETCDSDEISALLKEQADVEDGEEFIELTNTGGTTDLTHDQSDQTRSSSVSPVKIVHDEIQPSSTLDTQNSGEDDSRGHVITEGEYDEEGGQEIVYSREAKWIFPNATKKRASLFLGSAIFLLLLVVVLAVVLSRGGGNNSMESTTADLNKQNGGSTSFPSVVPFRPEPVPSLAPLPVPTLAPLPVPTLVPSLPPVRPTLSPMENQLFNIVSFISIDALNDPSSPQARAYDMLLNEEVDVDNTEKTIQRYVSMTFVMSLVEGDSSSEFVSVDDECTWDYITCSDGKVTHIRMVSMGLTGSVPPEVSYLDDLVLLDLSKNEIQGAIPERIFSMTKLEELYLHNNLLTGSLLVSGQSSIMKTLNLANNGLMGRIPDNLSSGLQFVSFYKNQFTGTIPLNLVTSNSLVYVDLSFNSLSGGLPAASGSSLRHLYLSHNSLTGQVPESYATGISLVSFYLDHNLLQGMIPTGFSQDHLQTLQLQGNNFEQELDQGICDLDIMLLGVVIDMTADCSICTCTNRLCNECIGRI